MFETSVIQGQARVATGRLSLFTISLIAHTAVIVGAVVVSIATIDFPSTAPDEFAQAPRFVPIDVPPPLGDPNGGARPKPPEAQPAATPPVQQNQITAPSPTTDTQATTQTQQAASTASDPIDGSFNPNATSTLPPGFLDGEAKSVGPLNGPIGIVGTAPAPTTNRIYEASEVKAPVGLYRPAPPYPQLFVKIKMHATVVVRCVIDKNGRVRDPQVIVPAAMAPFNESVLTTVRQWRFTAGSLNGEAVETYMNLTVNFAVN